MNFGAEQINHGNIDIEKQPLIPYISMLPKKESFENADENMFCKVQQRNYNTIENIERDLKLW